jgi:hypothetical protein
MTPQDVTTDELTKLPIVPEWWFITMTTQQKWLFLRDAVNTALKERQTVLALKNELSDTDKQLLESTIILESSKEMTEDFQKEIEAKKVYKNYIGFSLNVGYEFPTNFKVGLGFERYWLIFKRVYIGPTVNIYFINRDLSTYDQNYIFELHGGLNVGWTF